MTDRLKIYMGDLSPEIVVKLYLLRLSGGSQKLPDMGSQPRPAVLLRREPLTKERSTMGTDGIKRFDERPTTRSQTNS